MISDRLQNFDSSAIRGAFQQAARKPGVIDLSVGFPEENTPEYIKLAGRFAIEEDHTRYTPPNGIAELRAAIATKLTQENDLNCSAENVTVVPGLTTGIMLAYLALINPGDEVIIADPYFPPYRSLVELLDGKAVLVNTFPDFQMTADRIEAKITPKTKLICLNSPNNPTGSVYLEAELRAIAALAKKHDIIIISDEIYEHFTYDTHHFSIGSIYEKTLTLNGFSKAYGMSGWRIGYIAGPQELIDAINALQQYVVFSSSSIGQHAALAALDRKPAVIDGYTQKRTIVKQLLGDKVDLHGLGGAFFAFLPTPGKISDLKFQQQALEAGVLVLPGRAFSSHTDYIRISYGLDYATVKQGIERLSKLY